MNDKLPMVVKENKLINSEKNNKRLVANIKKKSIALLKVVIGGTILINPGILSIILESGAIQGAIIGSSVAQFIVPAITPVAVGIAGANFLKGFVDIAAEKKSKNSMFGVVKTKKLKIGQYPSIKGIQEMKKLNSKSEKASLMGIDIITMMQGFQQEYRDIGKMIPSKDGKQMVYPQIFETDTHGVNVRMIETLEKMGYIEILQKEKKGKSILFLERLAFGEHQAAREALISKMKGKNEGARQVYHLEVRLTDKELNLEKMYKEYLENNDTKGKNTHRNSNLIAKMLEDLKDQNIDIRTNELGEQELVYDATTSLAKRVEKEVEEERRSKKFMEEIDARGEKDEPVAVHEQENELTTEKINEGEEKE